MGNSGSATVQNATALHADDSRRLYHLVDMHGGGELIPWMRYAINSGKHDEIDKNIEEKVKDFMYNQGKGKMEAISELVKRRNKERNAMLGALYRKKGKGKSGPNILEDFNQEGVNQGDLKKALKLLDGGGKGGKNESKYREITWRLEERGTMGENLVGVCLLQGTNVHNKLAIKLIQCYPKLVNDIFLSEEYYGLSPLHQAVVNEDPTMVNYLLQNGADVNQRCYGAFFCCDDQKSSRTDSLEHEYVELTTKTNYSGRMYFGEYALAFAACTNQFDCYRLMRMKKADPNLKDTNGNTILHLCVIHEKPEMLKFAYDTGAKLQMTNKQNLTPLTLAAKLAKKHMFEQILSLEGEVLWVYGDASSIAYPLAKIDTISEETGALNEDSALSYVVYGESQEHLALLEGLLEDLLQAKWDQFARFQLIRSFTCFVLYYIFFVIAFMTRPLDLTDEEKNYNATGDVTISPISTTTPYSKSSTQSLDWFALQQCHLWSYRKDGVYGYVRLVAEVIVISLVVFQIIDECLDIYRIGQRRWWQVLKSFPAKILYKIALLLILVSVPMRLLCGLDDNMLIAENFIILVSVIFNTVHFLYYSRAKYVKIKAIFFQSDQVRRTLRVDGLHDHPSGHGPICDHLRHFPHGFLPRSVLSPHPSTVPTGFFLVFLACERERKLQGLEPKNILSDPSESLLRLFVMTIGEFTVFYRELNACQKDAYIMTIFGKVMFVVFELFVSIMQFNLLIAMMTRTYETIFRTQKEWKRQWAQVILMLELSLKPKDRMSAMLRYSRPIGTDKRRRAFMVSRKKHMDDLSESEKRMRELAEARKNEEKRLLLKRRLKDFTLAIAKDGFKSIRPGTSYLIPTPQPRRKL
uniref:ANK_REP_REGION domain-containing protein n=1 Tax=Steinernema glaseri TaxID=37863 RepID=A0A1I7ZQ96_9BILA